MIESLIGLAITMVKEIWKAAAPEDQAVIEAQMIGAMGEMRGTQKDTSAAHDAAVADALAAIEAAKKAQP